MTHESYALLLRSRGSRKAYHTEDAAEDVLVNGRMKALRRAIGTATLQVAS